MALRVYAELDASDFGCTGVDSGGLGLADLPLPVDRGPRGFALSRGAAPARGELPLFAPDPACALFRADADFVAADVLPDRLRGLVEKAAPPLSSVVETAADLGGAGAEAPLWSAVLTAAAAQLYDEHADPVAPGAVRVRDVPHVKCTHTAVAHGLHGELLDASARADADVCAQGPGQVCVRAAAAHTPALLAEGLRMAFPGLGGAAWRVEDAVRAEYACRRPAGRGEAVPEGAAAPVEAGEEEAAAAAGEDAGAGAEDAREVHRIDRVAAEADALCAYCLTPCVSCCAGCAGLDGEPIALCAVPLRRGEESCFERFHGQL